MIKVIFMISVDVIKHSEAHLTSKNRSSKNLLSCLEALYVHRESSFLSVVANLKAVFKLWPDKFMLAGCF